jgi:hypothetical protein
MKKGNPVAGYALLLALAALVILIAVTVAHDIGGGNRTPEVAARPETADTLTAVAAPAQSQPAPQQGRIWEGIM